MDLTGDWQSRKTLASTNLSMMANKVVTNIRFVFPDKTTVDAHKYMLMSRSTVFYAMFEGSMKTAEKEVKIEDIEHDTFEEMLKFLYTEEAQITNETVYQLLYAAEKYQILGLKDKCGEFLAQTIQSVEIALNLLSTADRYNVDNMNGACAEYIGKNLDKENVSIVLEKAVSYNHKVLTQKALHFLGTLGHTALQHVNGHTLSRKALNVLLDSNELTVEEIDVFRLCDRWATQACQKKGQDACSSAKREMLGPLLYKLRFPTMTANQFATMVSASGLLTLEEEVDIFRYLCGCKSERLLFSCKHRGTFNVEHITPGRNISIKSKQPWRLVGFKLSSPNYVPLQIHVDGRNLVNHNVLPQANANAYLEQVLVNTLTFKAESKVDIVVSPTNFAQYATTPTPRVAAGGEWSADIVYDAGAAHTPLSGLVYQIKNT